VFARFPRFSAWVIVLALVGIGTAGGVLGLRAMQPAAPANLAHVHGIVVAVQNNGTFAVQLPGAKSALWFRVAPGAPISLDHLRRHLREHAPTDIFYRPQMRLRGMFLAWEAD
jgi:hypothetical protein